MAQNSNKRSTTARQTGSIRLLLHCPDGAVPFLTPHLLQKCFPPTSQLLLGVAVRDTCVAAVYKQGKNNQKKPGGYTFSSETGLDAWLKDYPKVAVPTFDLLQDATDRQKSIKTMPQKVTVTNQHVSLWTANGRIPLTPAQYHDAAVHGLDSGITVPLFDTLMDQESIQTTASLTNTKRKVASVKRTQDFLDDFLTRQETNSKSTTVLAPYLVAPDDSIDLHGPQMSVIQTKLQAGSVSGVALIGSQYLPDDRYKSVLESVVSDLASAKEDCTVAVLSTQTLVQVLQAARAGVNVIASRLPTLWAQSKKALAVNLQWQGDDNQKRRRLDEEPAATKSDDDMKLDAHGCIDLNPTKDMTLHPWFRDPRPIDAGCTCHTCRTHSRSYLYHLVCAKELLAEILLFCHNLHAMLQVVGEFQTAHETDQADELYEYLMGQLGTS